MLSLPSHASVQPLPTPPSVLLLLPLGLVLSGRGRSDSSKKKKNKTGYFAKNRRRKRSRRLRSPCTVSAWTGRERRRRIALFSPFLSVGGGGSLGLTRSRKGGEGREEEEEETLFAANEDLSPSLLPSPPTNFRAAKPHNKTGTEDDGRGRRVKGEVKLKKKEE